MNKKNFKQVYFLVLTFCFVLFLMNACTENKNENAASRNQSNKIPITSNDSRNIPQKTYQQMSEAEQNKFVAEESDKILQKLGFEKSGKMNAKGLESVKPFVDSYAKRLDAPKKETCGFGDILSQTLKRGIDVTKDIQQAFRTEGFASETGIYLAMMESEFCVCIQSPTGPLGLFQLNKAIAEENGLEVKNGASAENPDQRCEIQPSAEAAAKYLKSLENKEIDGALNTAIALRNFNSGTVGKIELSEELKKSPNSQESFWALLTDEKISNDENKKYLSKFIAAAIVGENPKTFGVDILPLSRVR